MTAQGMLPGFDAAPADAATRTAPCESCGGRLVITRTANPFEDDWHCTSCSARGNISWSRVFGERAERAKAVSA